ncbi:MAG: three-Cys-motif partner protein TcmP [Luteolibacter sp.]
MPAPKQSFGGSWTAEKLERLRKYLAAYVQIMKRQSWCDAYCYLDAFAGTGYNTAKNTSLIEDSPAELLPDITSEDTQRFLDSSVRLALGIDPPFSQYVFIEKSAQKARELEKLREEFPSLADRILPLAGDANEKIQAICKDWNWKKRRAVLFLDPFGMQVSWKTIELVAKTEAIDMFLLFPAGIGVNRMLPGHGNIPESWRRRLDDILGVPESVWYPEFFKPQERDLFGETPIQKTATITSIGNYFNQRLGTVFDCVAPSPLELRNDAGTVLYLLCFAAKNKTALKIASHLLQSGK